MHIVVAGIGALGAALAFELLHRPEVTLITLVQHVKKEHKMRNSVFWDLLPVAKAVRKQLRKSDVLPKNPDAIVVSVGTPKCFIDDNASDLLISNRTIVAELLAKYRGIPKVFIATEPTEEIAAWLDPEGVNVKSIESHYRAFVALTGDDFKIVSNIFDNGGIPVWSAAYSIADQVISDLKNRGEK